MIDITLIGTGATMPLPGRALSCARLRCRGRSILFDCGEGTQTAARKAGVSLMKTDLIALTHYHGDHIFGLPGLLQSMSCLGRRDPLYITGPAGLEEAMTPILRLAGETEFPVRLLRQEQIWLSGLHPAWPGGACLRSFDTEHRVPSQGCCFTLARPPRFLPDKAAALGIPVRYWKEFQRCESRTDTVLVAGRAIPAELVTAAERRGLRVVFSGDTAPCAALEAAAQEADLLICDATYGSDEQAGQAELYGHSTFSRTGALAGRAGVRRLWLTHFSQTVDPEACLGNAVQFFPGAECGFDGKTIVLGFDRE